MPRDVYEKDCPERAPSTNDRTFGSCSSSSSSSSSQTSDEYKSAKSCDRSTTLTDLAGFTETRPLLSRNVNPSPSCQCCGQPIEAPSRKQRLKTRLGFVVSNITVEPLMFLNVLAWTMQTTLVTNMVLEKECEFKYRQTSEACQNLTSLPLNVTAGVQKAATTVMMLQEVVANIPAVLYVLVLGTWSDKYGRKLPMLLPFVGSFFASLVYMANAYIWWLPAELIIVAGIPQGLSGGLITLLMATYAYISDVSDHRSRTLRMAFLDFVMFIGTPLGLYLSNVIFNRFGYKGVFTISSSAFLLGLIYILLRIEDSRGPSVEPSPDPHQRPSVRNQMVKDLFDLSKIKGSLAIATRKREGHVRARIFSLMVAMCLLLFILGGHQLKYLYTKARFKWTYEQFVNLSIFDIVFGSVGTSLVLPVLSYQLRMPDTTIGLIGCISKMIGLVLIAVSPAPWFLYLAATLSFLAGLPLIVTRAVISKLVPPEEVGAIFSLLASWEALVPLFSAPVYTFVYNSTVEAFPGTIYFVSASVTAVSLLIYLFNSMVRNKKGSYVPI
ncbi:lysosomal proton-coupled steroid conjugate and bile acid symporter SLC46A3-like [Palaemon carinicauda]|uniref:lysosomal proton-coupled steroid conjugate and bile acid symporter SLC46A3-like n=1 Tax=Palaemon carinicauda TaxID=392227 RepID=UPI0035B67A1A